LMKVLKEIPSGKYYHQVTDEGTEAQRN
jgi:hypothetical protein